MRTFLMLPCLLIGLVDPASAAETKSAAGTATASKFYVVRPDGTSRQQDPVREGVALGADKRLSGKSQKDQEKKSQPATKRPPEKPPARQSTIRVKSSQDRPPRDESAALRCEQLGFYYTKDGRCIVPAPRRPATPPEPPRPPVGVTPPR